MDIIEKWYSIVIGNCIILQQIHIERIWKSTKLRIPKPSLIRTSPHKPQIRTSPHKPLIHTSPHKPLICTSPIFPSQGFLIRTLAGFVKKTKLLKKYLCLDISNPRIYIYIYQRVFYRSHDVKRLKDNYCVCSTVFIHYLVMLN